MARINNRLEFATRHFLDLQTIRFAPVPMAMIFGPLAASRVTQLSRALDWALLSGFLLFAAVFYRWTAIAIRRRYGSVRLSREDALRMRRHPVILSLNVVLAAALISLYFFAPRTYLPDVYIAFTVLIAMLQTILDPTNLAGRRIAWASGLVVVFTGSFILRTLNGGPIALTGAVWLSLSLYDFLLLRRTFREISAAGPASTTETLVPRG